VPSAIAGGLELADAFELADRAGPPLADTPAVASTATRAASTRNPSADASQYTLWPTNTTEWSPSEASEGTVQFTAADPLASATASPTAAPSNVSVTCVPGATFSMCAVTASPGLAVVTESEQVACTGVGCGGGHP
jgi:hypothetical protein